MIEKFIEALENVVKSHNDILTKNSLLYLDRTLDEMDDIRRHMYYYNLINGKVNKELEKVIAHYRSELAFATEETTIRLYK